MPGQRAHEGLIILTYLSALGVAGLIACAFIVASTLWGGSSIFFMEGFVFLALGLLCAFAFRALGLTDKHILYVTVSIALVVLLLTGFLHFQLTTTIVALNSGMQAIQGQNSSTGANALSFFFEAPLDFTTYLIILLITFNFVPYLMSEQVEKGALGRSKTLE